jgi:U3 small nucleolar RNA-associated protein 12
VGYLFLEEERENELGAIYEKGIADTLVRSDAPIGSGVADAQVEEDAEAGIVSKQTSDTLTAGE